MLERCHHLHRVLSLDLASVWVGCGEEGWWRFMAGSLRARQFSPPCRRRGTERRVALPPSSNAEHALDVTTQRDSASTLTSSSSLSRQREQALESPRSWPEQRRRCDRDRFRAALVRSKRLKGYGDAIMGLQARLMSRPCESSRPISKSHTMCFCQPDRMKIGIMFGNPETTREWNALKFYASVRLERPDGWGHQAGSGCYRQPDQGRVVKNKVRPSLSRGGV